jgi:hypothetical protein
MQNTLEGLERKKELIINSKANTSFTVITNKKKSEHPKSPQSPQSPQSPLLMNLRSALRNEKLIDNPKLRLSIEDYEKMCNNKILRRMMAKLLNTDIKSLTTYCINVKGLDKYIDLSQNKIKEKTMAKKSPIKDLLPILPPDIKAETLKFFHLPEHIIEHITHDSFKSLYKSKFKLEKYKLVDGIPAHKLLEYPMFLFKNPNALYFLMENNIEVNYYWLSGNTNPIAIELLKEEIKVNPEARIHWEALSKNPKAIKILKANRDKIFWGILSFNTKLISKSYRFLGSGNLLFSKSSCFLSSVSNSFSAFFSIRIICFLSDISFPYSGSYLYLYVIGLPVFGSIIIFPVAGSILL